MSKLEVFYPGVYSAAEQLAIEQFLKDGDKMQPRIFENSKEKMLSFARRWNRWNPFFADPEYAKNTKNKQLVAMPCFADPYGFPPMLSSELGDPISPDYVYIGDGYDHEIIYYAPITAEDTYIIQPKPNSLELLDITPEHGSEIRGFILKNETEMTNQEGKVVARGIMRWPEFRCKYKDPSDRPPPEQMRPNIQNRYEHPIHNYTNEDWECIQSIWKNEKIRGADTLFWDDVNIGDEPAWTTEGPVTQMDMIRLHGHSIVGGVSLRDHFLAGQGEYVRADDGLFYPDQFSHFMNHFGGRPQFKNTTGRNSVVRMVTNWCGDDGVVCRINWRIINNMPPDKQANHFPEEFVRPSFLLKVPYLKSAGRFLNSHGLVPDCIISKGYVVDKYITNQDHFVELSCWCEDLDGNIFTECAVVVKLPSREN